MSDVAPKIAESYFNNLLNDTPSIEAVYEIARFWGHRMELERENFGASVPEYFSELCLKYIGEVTNGGHAQYYQNRGTRLAKDTSTALAAIGCEMNAKVLSSSFNKLSNIKRCDRIDPKIIPRETYEFWSECDNELWTLKSIDEFLLGYLQANSNIILVPERN